jgi:predicted nucleotidyltransferase
VEIPSIFACATAEKFALGAVTLAHNLGCVDYLCFGSETADLDAIKETAEVLISGEADEKIKELLKNGITYAAARNEAVLSLSKKSGAVLSNPNDILGVEYVKALLKLKSDIKPTLIKREGAGHNDKFAGDKTASASFIRENLSRESLAEFCPCEVFEIFEENLKNGNCAKGTASLETALLLKLRTMTLEQIEALPDVSEGLHNRIYKAATECTGLDELCEKIKTKRYTMARIRRILMYALLDFEKEALREPIPYIRVLGFNQKGRDLLSQKKNKIPVVSSLAAAREISPFFARCEEKTTAVFNLTLENQSFAKNEFTSQIIKL